MAGNPQEVRLRPPTVEDAADMWHIVVESGVLDANSVYCYLLVCRDFAATSVVAEAGGRVIGFASGYRLPNKPDTLFVWQIGVEPAERGRKVASRMLDDLIARSKGIIHLETTIAPSNQASRRLFEQAAARHGADMHDSGGFATGLFPGGAHEPEHRYRIGPFRSTAVQAV